jgi:hypothetical protein
LGSGPTLPLANRARRVVATRGFLTALTSKREGHDLGRAAEGDAAFAPSGAGPALYATQIKVVGRLPLLKLDDLVIVAVDVKRFVQVVEKITEACHPADSRELTLLKNFVGK